MAKTSLIIAKQDAKLFEILNEVQQAKERANERMKFLAKQAKQYSEEVDVIRKRAWIDAKSRLKELNLLPPEYSDKEYTLCYDGETTLITMEKDSDIKGRPGILEMLHDLMH